MMPLNRCRPLHDRLFDSKMIVGFMRSRCLLKLPFQPLAVLVLESHRTGTVMVPKDALLLALYTKTVRKVGGASIRSGVLLLVPSLPAHRKKNHSHPQYYWQKLEEELISSTLLSKVRFHSALLQSPTWTYIIPT
jgi:hypothetical protein